MSGQDEHEKVEGAQPAGAGHRGPLDGQDAALDVHQREGAGAQRRRRVGARSSERAPATRGPRGASGGRRRAAEPAVGQRPPEAAETAAGGVLASCDAGVARAGLERPAAAGAEVQVDLVLGAAILALALPVEAARAVEAALGDPGPAVQVLAPAAPPELIEAEYQDLLGLQRRAGLALAVAIGGLMIARLYGGDSGAWRARGPKDDASLRALAERAIRRLTGEYGWLVDRYDFDELLTALVEWMHVSDDVSPQQALGWQTPGERRAVGTVRAESNTRSTSSCCAPPSRAGQNRSSDRRHGRPGPSRAQPEWVDGLADVTSQVPQCLQVGQGWIVSGYSCQVAMGNLHYCLSDDGTEVSRRSGQPHTE
jgi:hypothetical protein